LFFKTVNIVHPIAKVYGFILFIFIQAWGLGFIIIYLYSKAIAIKNVSPDWPALSSQLKELLRGLLRMDPRKRLDCVEALNLFNPSSHVLSSGPGKAWLEQREAVRAQL